uniref:EF-hand domain-containing protein n=1 Tax=Pinguiococcus pyrenoidosus TaxID=172671 RepID=A0A7R9U4B1_9STRA|mmetsp:Transcript_12977/g.48117  ORF Transcript_12977/g.48117 Transcript_12977/m.48117 type:complete len:323 (+) Transcript_12977:1-969(+)
MACATFLARLSQELDITGDGLISRDEWKKFLELLRDERRHYLKQRAFVRSWPLAYWARGTGANHTDMCGLVSSGMIPQGYFDDLWYYIANHHPILSICFCDEDHPLTTLSKVVLETEVLLVTLLGAGIAYAFIRAFGVSREQEENNEPTALLTVYLFALFFITIPSMTVATMLIYLQSCPCLIYKRSTDRRTCLRGTCLCIGRIISVTLLLIVGFLAIVGVILGLELRGEDFLFWWISGRVQAYFLWFLWLLFREFNLLFSIPFLGIGRWKTEREKSLNGSGSIFDNVQVTLEEEAIYEGAHPMTIVPLRRASTMRTKRATL